MVLTVSFVLAPETGLFVSVPDVMRSIIVRLISASGYQAHTTSPSVSHAPVLRRENVHRIPCPTFSDDRETPLIQGHGTREDVLLICPTPQPKRPAADWHDEAGQELGPFGKLVYAFFHDESYI
jgi:hypothetical protein